MPASPSAQKSGTKKSGTGKSTGKPAGKPGKKRPLTVLALAFVLTATLILGVLSALGSPAEDGGGSGGGEAGAAGGTGETVLEPLPEDHPALALARRAPDDPMARGEVDAPVVLIEYADFQCAFCGIHARDTDPLLVEEYVEAGVLRIEFRNFPIFGPESDSAARASWAAGEQGRFWEFYEAAYAEEFHRDSGRFEGDSLLALASEAGVPDLERFQRDMESEEAGEAVGRDAEEGYELGVTSTPAFLVNGHALLGAQPIAAFRDTIDQLTP